MIAPTLHADALARAGREIHRARYLSVTVTDEQLAELAIVAYQEAVRVTPRKPRATPSRPRRPAKA